MMAMSWVLLLCVISDIIGIGGVGAFEMFGTLNPWDEHPSLPNRPESLPDARNLVALMHHPVMTEGDVFAFTARVSLTEPFYFQIWQPTGNRKQFKLIASRQVTPSVTAGQHENFYMLGDDCIHVLPNDTLGLFFTTLRPPVYYGESDFHDKIVLNGIPAVGDTFSFTSDLSVIFVATGFVNTNSDAAIRAVTCNSNETLRNDFSQLPSSTTTYLPPTGIPGAIGATGQIGVRGFTGQIGMTGDTGTTGATGGTGFTGHTGPIGYTGAINSVKGAVGEVGSTGRQGNDGDTGPQGFQGETGVKGPQGLAGDNHTVMIYGPYRYWPSTDNGNWLNDPMWWEHSMAMTVVYIWLAVVSLVLLLTFVIVLVICCQCNNVQRALKKDTDL